MRANLPNRAGTGTGRIGTPGCLFLTRFLQRLCKPVLRIFQLRDPQAAKRTIGNHLACLSYQRIACVIMSQEKMCCAGGNGCLKDLGLCHRRRKGFVADDMNTSL